MFRKKRTAGETAESPPPGHIEPMNPRTRTFVMVSLALGMLMSAMNQTIVGTSVPDIVGDLGGMSLFSWLFTAYTLAEVVTIPIAGKMSDRFGRRTVFLAGVLLFLAGTILASTSTSMEMLILLMFVQGLGSGIIMPVALATVADLYAPAEMGKMQGLLGAVFAVAAVIGPLIGGFVVDHASWRLIYWISVPMGALALIVIATRFPQLSRNDQAKRIDVLGMSTFSISLAALLLLLNWGGTTYAWDSIEIIGLGILSVLALAVFIMNERKVEDPILPLRLFRNRIFSLSSVGLIIVGLALFGVISFLPMFQQAVIGMSASSSGVTLIPLLVGLMIMTVISGFTINRTGYKVWLLAGPPVSALGLYLLSTLGVGSSQIDAIIYTFMVGLGIGMLISNYIVATQNVTSKKDMGVVTASLTLFRTLGGAFGVALLGGVVNRQMTVELGHNLPAAAAAALPATDVNTLGGLLLSPEAAGQIPAAILDAIRISLGDSMTYMFLVAAVIVLCAIAVNVLIKEMPLRESEDERTEIGPEGTGSKDLHKRILIPTDGSEHSRSAVEYALELAQASNAEVTALSVVDTMKATSALRDLAPAPPTSSMVGSAEAALDQATGMAKKAGVSMRTEIRTGDPAALINEMSARYDLIVMGNRGLHGLPHLLLGSVAEKVMSGSKCPVIVVKKDARIVVERTPAGTSKTTEASKAG